MAQRLAIPPQISERTMPEGALGFKLARCQVPDARRMLPPDICHLTSDYWLATVTPRRFSDQHPSEASGHSGRSLP
jgi:hypothetical protein